MRSMKVNLQINGIDVKVGYKYLEDSISEIPDIPANKKVFGELAKSESDLIRKDIVE